MKKYDLWWGPPSMVLLALVLLMWPWPRVGAQTEASTTVVTEPIRVMIYAGPELEVTVPNVAKKDVADITAGFFGRGDEAAKAKFEKLVGQAKQITFIVTTKR
jgi:hypothetical protein